MTAFQDMGKHAALAMNAGNQADEPDYRATQRHLRILWTLPQEGRENQEQDVAKCTEFLGQPEPEYR